MGVEHVPCRFPLYSYTVSTAESTNLFPPAGLISLSRSLRRLLCSYLHRARSDVRGGSSREIISPNERPELLQAKIVLNGYGWFHCALPRLCSSLRTDTPTRRPRYAVRQHTQSTQKWLPAASLHNTSSFRTGGWSSFPIQKDHRMKHLMAALKVAV